MPGDRRKTFLFLDDDPDFLRLVTEFFAGLSQGGWRIFPAHNHAEALAVLRQERIDVVVLDFGMPVMDGLQFLRLLSRSHPGQQAVMLTSMATEENRKACLEAGAALFLEKPRLPEEFTAVYGALDALAGASGQDGFRGLVRRVGLQEVLQMECLGRKSSIMSVFTPEISGRIFIEEGAIVHADCGALQGEVALYTLLGFRGGEFNLLPFSAPPARTISGQWESLLMEAARLKDEQAATAAPPGPRSLDPADTEFKTDFLETDAGSLPRPKVRIEEILLCSGSGEVLYEWQCPGLRERLRLFEQVDRMAAELGAIAPIGRFERLEVLAPGDRMVCELQTDRRLLVRSSPSGGDE